MDATGASSHAHGHETLSEKNAKHFDKVVGGPWPKWVLFLHSQIVEFLTSTDSPPWIGLPSSNTGTRMLDYACGDGIITKSLKPHFASAIGVDVSGSMLDKYRATADGLGLGPGEMVGVRGDLLADNVQPTDPPLSNDNLWHFDLVAISMALHHFDNPEVSLQRLAGRLKVGGALLVIDYTPRDGSTRAQREYEEELREQKKEDGSLDNSPNSAAIAARHTVSKPNGFTRQEMGELFEKAGCTGFKWKLAEELTPIPVANTKAQLFWARATKL